MSRYGTTEVWATTLAAQVEATHYAPDQVTPQPLFAPFHIPDNAYVYPAPTEGIPTPQKTKLSTRPPVPPTQQEPKAPRRPFLRDKLENPMLQLVKATTKGRHTNKTGTNVARLRRKKPPQVIHTHHCYIDTSQSRPAMRQQVYEWIDDIVRTMAIYYQNPTRNYTAIPTLFDYEQVPETKDAVACPHDIVAEAPGITNQVHQGYHAQIQTLAVNGLDGRHCCLIPVPAKEHEPALKLGNPHENFLSWVQEEQDRNLRPPEFTTPLPLCLLSLLDVQHYFAIQSFINSHDETIVTALNRYLFPAVTIFAPYHRVSNLIHSLRHSSLQKYMGHLNRLAEYFTYLAMAWQRESSHETKADILQAIQEGTITTSHLQQTLLYLKSERNLSPVYILNVHAGFAFFFRHFTGTPLHLVENYQLSIKVIRHMDWDQDHTSHLLTAPQIDALINICKSDPQKYGTLGYIIEFGAAMILRTSELVGQVHFPDVEYERHWVNQTHLRFLTLTLHKAKNARIPKTKMIPLTRDMIIDPATAYKYLLNRAQDKNGPIAVRADGTPIPMAQFRELLKKAFKALLSLYPELKGKRLSWYSIRSGMLIAMMLAGFSESEIKAISLHSQNSRVLNSSYLDKLRKIENVAYGAFLHHFGKPKPSIPTLPKQVSHDIWQHIQKDLQKFLHGLRHDFYKRVQTDNLVEKRLIGIDSRPVTAKLLRETCNGQLSPTPSQPTPAQKRANSEPLGAITTPAKNTTQTSQITQPQTPTPYIRPEPNTTASLPNYGVADSDSSSPEDDTDTYEKDSCPSDEESSSPPLHQTPTKRRVTPKRRAKKPISHPVWPLHNFPWDKVIKLTTLSPEEMNEAKQEINEEVENLDWNENLPHEIRERQFRELAETASRRIGRVARASFVRIWEAFYGLSPIPEDN